MEERSNGLLTTKKQNPNWGRRNFQLWEWNWTPSYEIELQKLNTPIMQKFEIWIRPNNVETKIIWKKGTTASSLFVLPSSHRKKSLYIWALENKHASSTTIYSPNWDEISCSFVATLPPNFALLSTTVRILGMIYYYYNFGFKII